MGTMKSRFTRRMFLGGVAATAVSAGTAAGLATAGTPRTAPARGTAATMDLTVVNETGRYGNADIRLYVVGNDGTRQVRLTPEGTVAPVALSDNGPDGYTDYAIPLAAGGATTLTLPHMSGRMYVALGADLKFKAVRDGNGNAALAYPAGWVSGDPNYDVLHDCAEFTFNSAGMFCNTTMVDMFSVPLSIRLTGAADQTTGTLRPGGRAQIFDALRGSGPFSSLVVDDRRVIAPGHGLDAGLFPADYFGGYIDRVWDTYASRDLRVTTNAGTFTGRVSGGRLSFTGPASVSFDRPSTRDVLFCDGALAAPNDGTTGPVAAILGAGFNRTTLAAHADQPTGDPGGFYQDDPVHAYARAMHEATEDGKAYGFAFDDVGGYASYIQDGAPRSFTLTLTPF
ncbi:beta-1,3-glucanase family protein [Streptomyces sp. DSM 42041]|uniref:Beta-1,3-glucanase family protein n=1 Tax=Streptomyces hazeniae TaxID=3075538 RepID=A0ABU2NY15_9ACTN|nr:beta-1,3-glucanase family protein [Streptomyces sp. DSM 42041]MDT0381881.1 beta-1,3-glucanase family protein [Streptomyces sp. DSM 42041]